jgi:hypothetical protein
MGHGKRRMSRHKKKSALLGDRQKRILYGAFSLQWLTGALYLGDKYLRGWSLPTASSTQSLLMKVHGAAAMVVAMVFGSLWLDHVPAGWAQNTKRPSGVILIGVIGFLMLTGWGLYYVGNEALRNWVGLLHWVVGLSIPLIIILHVRAARQKEMPSADRLS